MSTTASTTAPAATPTTRTRSVGLDRLRGLAVVLMVLDHLLLVGGLAGHPLRETLTRAAMPLFAVLAGHLCRRYSWRWAGVFLVGAFLPGAVPWIDAPNILCWLSLGAALVALGRRYPVVYPLVMVLALTLFANGYGATPGSFQPLAVWALMVVGALLHRPWLETLGRCVPDQLRPFGRYPLTLYVGHLLALQLWVVAGA